MATAMRSTRNTCKRLLSGRLCGLVEPAWPESSRRRMRTGLTLTVEKHTCPCAFARWLGRPRAARNRFLRRAGAASWQLSSELSNPDRLERHVRAVGRGPRRACARSVRYPFNGFRSLSLATPPSGVHGGASAHAACAWTGVHTGDAGLPRTRPVRRQQRSAGVECIARLSCQDDGSRVTLRIGGPVSGRASKDRYILAILAPGRECLYDQAARVLPGVSRPAPAPLAEQAHPRRTASRLSTAPARVSRAAPA